MKRVMDPVRPAVPGDPATSFMTHNASCTHQDHDAYDASWTVARFARAHVARFEPIGHALNKIMTHDAFPHVPSLRARAKRPTVAAVITRHGAGLR